MRISVNLGNDEEFHKRLRIASAISGETMGDFVKKAVDDRIKNEEKTQGDQK